MARVAISCCNIGVGPWWAGGHTAVIVEEEVAHLAGGTGSRESRAGRADCVASLAYIGGVLKVTIRAGRNAGVIGLEQH